MSRLVRTSGVAALLFGLGAGVGAHDTAIGDPPDQVTTDTLAYCRQLALRLETMTNAGVEMPATVVNLSTAGKRMCDAGLVRGGIMRLRSAIVIMLHQHGSDLGRTRTTQ